MTDDDFDQDDFEEPEQEHFACLFPDFCVIPSPHFTSECYHFFDAARDWDEAMKSTRQGGKP